MKYEIEIEGLPEGWRPVAHRLPKIGDHVLYQGTIHHLDGDGIFERLVLEKIQPRRVILEETQDNRVPIDGEWIESFGGFSKQIGRLYIGTYQIWREVKENEEKK